MPNVLIAGCGYTGIAAAKLFRKDGWKITAWTRSGQLSDLELASAIVTHAVDVSEPGDVQRNKFDCNLVVHCASSGGGDVGDYRRVYRDGAANLAAAFTETRIIFTSSTSVYGQRNGSWVDENSPAEPATEKGRILREAEEIVLENSGTVLRLAGLYGPGRSFLLRSVRNGTASAAGSPDRYVNQVHRDDTASAIFLLAGQASIAPRRIFNVVDDTPAPRGEILNWLSIQLQIPLALSVSATSSKRGDSNKRVSNRRLRSLGWSPLYASYKEGFLRSVLPAAEQF